MIGVDLHVISGPIELRGTQFGHNTEPLHRSRPRVLTALLAELGASRMLRILAEVGKR